MVKYLPVMQETWVQYLNWEDPLEKGMATHSNICAWICCVMGAPLDKGAWSTIVCRACKELDTTDRLNTHTKYQRNMY